MIKELIKIKKPLLFMEVHSPMSAYIIDQVSYVDQDKICHKFDGF